RKFSPENHEVELLGSNIIVYDRRRKPGNMFDQFMPGICIDLVPSFPGTVLLHVAAVWPDEEIVEPHARNLSPQFGRQTIAQRLDFRGAIGSGARFTHVTVRCGLLNISVSPRRYIRPLAIDFAN